MMKRQAENRFIASETGLIHRPNMVHLLIYVPMTRPRGLSVRTNVNLHLSGYEAGQERRITTVTSWSNMKTKHIFQTVDGGIQVS